MCIPNKAEPIRRLSALEERQQLIDKLNDRVAKITQQEVAKSPVSTTPLAPEFVHAQQPMTLLNAGYPVYQLRNQYCVYVYTAIAMVILGYATVQLHPLVSLLCIVTMFLGYDLYSGILHVVLDHPANIAVPVLGQPCLEFQWHHSIPDDIVRKHFVDVCGDLNVVIGIVMAINLLLLPIRENPICLALGGAKLLMAYFGQYSHRSAHSVGSKLSPVAKLLQKYHVMISTKDHMDHHQAPYSIDFCLIGVCNPIIDALRRVTHSNAIWLTLFLVWSIFDLAIFTHLVTRCAVHFNLA
jgi:palmitoyl-[glycerolipid] 3-(E)-desaturase